MPKRYRRWQRGGMLVKDCVNYADISCNDQTGGITGWVDYHKIATNTDYCVNLGKISGGKWVGGIVGGMDGHDYYTRVYKCGNYGSVTSNGEHAGGIVGTCQNKRIRVWNCANHGDIQSNCDGGAWEASPHTSARIPTVFTRRQTLK